MQPAVKLLEPLDHPLRETPKAKDVHNQFGPQPQDFKTRKKPTKIVDFSTDQHYLAR